MEITHLAAERRLLGLNVGVHGGFPLVPLRGPDVGQPPLETDAYASSFAQVDIMCELPLLVPTVDSPPFWPVRPVWKGRGAGG